MGKMDFYLETLDKEVKRFQEKTLNGIESFKNEEKII